MLGISRGRAGLLLNAKARLGLRAENSAADALRRSGLDLARSIRVSRPRNLVRAAESLMDLGIDRLIVGGGDGTIAPRVADRKCVLGILPLGTANDFARSLKIPASIDRAAEVAAGSAIDSVDLAKANDAYFLNVASVGMSVAATRVLSPRLKRGLGPIAYAVAGARVFWGHGLFDFRMEADESVEGLAHQVVVANGRFYGGGVLVAHDSTLDDGALTAYGLGARGRWELLRTVALLKMRVPLDKPGDAYLRARSLRLETTPRLPVSLDGEIRTHTIVDP